jgi:hypothetical protein
MTDRAAEAKNRREPAPEPSTPPHADSGPQVQGEGNYAAAQEYGASTQDFVRSGRVEDAARAAVPADEGEAAELLLAVEAAKERAKEEDPTVDRGRSLRR